MAETIELTVSDDKSNNTKKAKAKDGSFWFPDQDGHIKTKTGRLIEWKGDSSSTGNFVVTFYDLSKCKGDDLKGWPFKEPNERPGDMLLRVNGANGLEKLHLKDQAGLWKYSVAVVDGQEVTPLDPMIIIRDSSNALMYYAGPVLAFMAGAVFAALVLRARRSGAR